MNIETVQPSGPELPRPAPDPRVPASLLGSFVRHDLYAPTAMLRHFLESMGAMPSDADSLRETIGYAAGLVGDLDRLLALLVDTLGELSGEAHPQPVPTSMVFFLMETVQELDWCGGSEQALFEASDALATDTLVLLEPDSVKRALRALVHQWSRMGSTPGTVRISLDEADPSCLLLHKPEGPVSQADLVRALWGAGTENEAVLRHLPACGLPFRAGASLLVRGSGAALTVEADPRLDRERGGIMRIRFQRAGTLASGEALTHD